MGKIEFNDMELVEICHISHGMTSDGFLPRIKCEKA